MQFQIHEKVFLSEPATDSSLWLGGILCQALLQATEMNVSPLPVGANAVRGHLWAKSALAPLPQSRGCSRAA